jgi:hypothetical protein
MVGLLEGWMVFLVHVYTNGFVRVLITFAINFFMYDFQLGLCFFLGWDGTDGWDGMDGALYLGSGNLNSVSPPLREAIILLPRVYKPEFLPRSMSSSTNNLPWLEFRVLSIY